jgi:YbbR domain-containing protein
MLRWLRDNLSTLALAVTLAVMVWASAVSGADPVVEQVLPQAVPVEVHDLAEGLVLVGPVRGEARVTVRAPRSVFEQLTAADITLEADLAGLGPGVHQVPLAAGILRRPARVTAIDPAFLTLTLEPIASRSVPVVLRTLGAPAVGFRVDRPEVQPAEVTVWGPATHIERVAQVVAEVNLTGLRQDLDLRVPLLPVDPSDQVVDGVTVTPAEARVVARIEQLGGYRDVAVKVVIVGQLEPGYWVTRITVSPPILTVYSADPEIVALLPGFVETEPLVLTGADSDLEVRLALDLPPGVAPVGEQSVLVQVGVAAIESSLTVTRTLDVQGLGRGLAAVASPDSVSVILRGPLPVLERLSVHDVRVVVDLLDLGVGTHQITPRVVVLPAGVTAQAVLPATVEVSIALAGATPAAP